MRVKEIAIIASLTTILIVQEQVFAFLLPPNIQLTVFLIVLYTRVLGAKKTAYVVTIHVFIDCLINSSLGLMVFVPMLIGWLLIPLTLGTVAKKVKSAPKLAILSIPLSIAYALCFFIAVVIVGELDIKKYFLADIPFTIVLALSSFLTILWLYDPLYKVVNDLHSRALNS